MKINILLAVIVSLLAATGADANPFDFAYGNTVRQKRPDGSTYDIFVNPDMTWEQRSGGGQISSGTYTWKDAAHVCFTQLKPPSKDDPSDAAACIEMKTAHNVGETWTEPLPDGKTLTTTIISGRK